MHDLTGPFTLYGPDNARSRTLDGTVDTGASFTVIPETVLDELGVARGELLLFSLADGSLQERHIGYASDGVGRAVPKRSRWSSAAAAAKY